MAIPEFILKKLVVPGSLQPTSGGFRFVILNTFAPASVKAFKLILDGKMIDPAAIQLDLEGESPRSGSSVQADSPLPLPVGKKLTVSILSQPLANGAITVVVDTREAGELSFRLQGSASNRKTIALPKFKLPAFLQKPFEASVSVDFTHPLHAASPRIYGQFVEHLERCVYDGIWDADGRRLRNDTMKLIQQLHPPLVRYPGGNFASGYHWEDGIGPVDQRPQRMDEAWHRLESNHVGTDEFMAFTEQIGCEAYLAVNDGSGTPEEAARWVAYCNEPETTEQGARRAQNGHPEPYHVRLWGIGNEVWGKWQIGTTSAAAYARRCCEFARAMRAVDPTIQLVAVGDSPLTDSPDDPAFRWNQIVLEACRDWIDFLSFHIYQPGEDGWQESYDPEKLHNTVCAAPLSLEMILRRISRQIQTVCPDGRIKLALDEWNLWLSPPAGAGSMHQVLYTQRDALYTAGMLNTFLRNADVLEIANLAQLVNVLPLIITGTESAVPTSIYSPFLLFNRMQPLVCPATAVAPTFNSEGLGRNITAHENVSYIDASATVSADQEQAAVILVNRHPERACQMTLSILAAPALIPEKLTLQSASSPLSANTLEKPDEIRLTEKDLSAASANGNVYTLPPASISLIEFRNKAG
jgi:alpha-N-arabinofuranosidase